MDNNEMMSSGLLTVGKVTRNQGNKGEVRVLPLTERRERFELLRNVFLVRGEEKQEARIEGIRYHKKFIIIKFKGIDDIKAALGLKDCYLKIPDEELLPLAENEFYIDRITGYRVFTVEGEKLGTLSGVMTTGGTDIFIVSGSEKEYMLPAAREIIREIDRDKEQIIVKPIPGLLEL